jgi:hypothetical protein
LKCIADKRSLLFWTSFIVTLVVIKCAAVTGWPSPCSAGFVYVLSCLAPIAALTIILEREQSRFSGTYCNYEPSSSVLNVGLRSRYGSGWNKTSGGSGMSETVPDQSPDQTTLLQTENAPSCTLYLRGVIGKLDLTLHPMIPTGSIVQIDTGKREVSPRKEWTNQFHRPIYFLQTKDGYFCGWCELNEDSQWLTLIPHPLSSTPSRRWRYGTEVENLGRVVSVVIRLRMNLTC